MNRLFKIMILFALAASLLCIISCSQEQTKEEDPVVAQVGSEKLYASTLTEMLKQQRSLVPENKQYQITPEMVIDAWIDNTVIAQEAKNRGYDKDENIAWKVAQYTNSLLVEKMWKEEVEKKIDAVTDEEVQQYYDEVKDRDYKTEFPIIRLSLLTVKTEGEAKLLAERARAGEDFAKLVEEYSIRKDLGLDGDMGFHRKEELPKNIADIAFSLKEGEVSEPLQLEVGYSIIKITSKIEPGGYMPLDEKTKKMVADRLLQEKRNKYAEDFLNELKKNTEVFKFLHKYQDELESEKKSDTE